MENTDNTIGIQITTTKNPKPDAPRYTIRTIGELMNVVNSENVDRFLSDFSTMLKIAVSTRELLQLIADDVAEKQFSATMEEFIWIDDHQ